MRVNRGRIETALDCLRRYHYTFNPHPGAPRGLVPLRMSPYLRQGILAHKFLEGWYLDDTLPTEERMQIATQAMRVRFEETAGKYDDLNGLFGEERTWDFMLGIMEAYTRTWGSSEEFSVLEPEVDACVPLGPDHQLRFQTDAVISYERRLWLLETKTTSQMGPQYLKKWDFNMQVIIYVYGTSVALKALVVGALMNLIKKPNPQAKSGASARPEFRRLTTMVTPDHIKNTLYTFNNVTDDISKRDPTDVRDWPQDTNRCMDYGGCPFREVCIYNSPAEVGSVYQPREADYVDNDDAKGLTPP